VQGKSARKKHVISKIVKVTSMYPRTTAKKNELGDIHGYFKLPPGRPPKDKNSCSEPKVPNVIMQPSVLGDISGLTHDTSVVSAATGKKRGSSKKMGSGRGDNKENSCSIGDSNINASHPSKKKCGTYKSYRNSSVKQKAAKNALNVYGK
jgi:hypothetical protein